MILLSCAEAARRRKPRLRRYANGWRRQDWVCIPTKPGSATAGSPAKALTFSATGSKPDAGWVRKKSLKRLKDKIRSKTRRTRGQSLAWIIDDLNPLLRGWFGYFKHAHPYTFDRIDKFVRRRLRAVLRKQNKRPGFGRSLNDHKRWPNDFFANAGLFATYAAWHAARHPR